MARYGTPVKPDTVNYYIRMTSAEADKIITRIEPIALVKKMVEQKQFRGFVMDLVAAQQARFGGSDWKVSVMTAARTEELFPLEEDDE